MHNRIDQSNAIWAIQAGILRESEFVDSAWRALAGVVDDNLSTSQTTLTMPFVRMIPRNHKCLLVPGF